MKRFDPVRSPNPRLADELKKERDEMDKGKYITLRDIKKRGNHLYNEDPIP